MRLHFYGELLINKGEKLNNNSINCPQCGFAIDIDEIYYKKIENEFRQKQQAFEQELQEKREQAKAYFANLKAKEQQLLAKEEQFQEALKKATKEQLAKEKASLQEQLKKEIQAEQEATLKLLQEELAKKSKEVAELNKAKAEIELLKQQQSELEAKAKLEAQKELQAKLQEQKELLAKELKSQFENEAKMQVKLMQKELEEKSKQLQELHLAKAEVEKLKREQEELKAKAKAEAEIELNKRLQEEKAKLQESLQDEVMLKLKQKDEQIKQMQRSLEDAKRKAEQASMQTQGEALELAIEEYLKSKFPFDSIEEVKKGAFGADCIQVVNTRELPNCGKICYESKNTKNWSNEWISKLKQDMLKVNADIGVLVTSVYPSGMDKMGFVDGIWVCSLSEFKGIVPLLRESLIKVAKLSKTQENRGDKMAMLYSYLTGNEFAMQLKAIVDGFIAMQNELDKEKRSLMASWKRRQKLIDSVLENTTQMYGSLQGIAGSGAIAHIKALEMPEEDE